MCEGQWLVLALVILSNFDLEAAGMAVNVLVVVIMSEVTWGCSVMENSSRSNVAGRLQRCWQQSAAAVTHIDMAPILVGKDLYKYKPDEDLEAHTDMYSSGLKCPVAEVYFANFSLTQT